MWQGRKVNGRPAVNGGAATAGPHLLPRSASCKLFSERRESGPKEGQWAAECRAWKGAWQAGVAAQGTAPCMAMMTRRSGPPSGWARHCSAGLESRGASEEAPRSPGKFRRCCRAARLTARGTQRSSSSAVQVSSTRPGGSLER